MSPYLIGAAGGSGSGKSTLAFGLEKDFPNQVSIFHIDDYFKPEHDVPHVNGIPNWDSPESLYAEKMVADLAKLKLGQSAIINTKSPKLNPDFLVTGKRIPVEFKPKPLIVVEGFLALYFEGIRNLLDKSIYLDAPFSVHTGRRLHGKLHKFPPEYDELILRPMHELYVKPTKLYADLLINVTDMEADKVLKEVIDKLELRERLA